MSMWSTLNRAVFKRTSTFAVAVAGGTFFFERTFELLSVSIFESLNKGAHQKLVIYYQQKKDIYPFKDIFRKLWNDIKHKYEN